MTQPQPANNPVYRSSVFPNAVDTITNIPFAEVGDAIMATQQAIVGGGAAGTGLLNVSASGTITGGSVATSGSVTVGNGAAQGPKLWGGSGVPAAGLGANGDYYFRTDAVAAAGTRIYVKSAGAWVATAA